jgi:hypothetical protein
MNLECQLRCNDACRINSSVTSDRFGVCEHNWSDNGNGSKKKCVHKFIQEIKFLTERKHNMAPLQRSIN